MEEIIESLEKLFSKNKQYHNYSDIVKTLNIKGENQEKILKSSLEVLTEEGIIFYDKKKGYKIFPEYEYAFGTIEINKSGTGFVHTTKGDIILIENSDLNGALNGDNVIVSNIYSKRKDYYSGEIYKIAKRKNGNIIFEVIKQHDVVNVIPYNKNEWINVDIDLSNFKSLIDGDLILVNVQTKEHDGVFEGNIIKILGHKDDPDIDIKVICEKNGINVEFKEEIVKEAKSLPKKVSETDIKGRKDERGETNFTIDCDNTKDRDDNVGIKKLDNGNYLLKVNIAHVSHYIKPYMKSFGEALVRCSSHYPGNSCIPMLHHIISNGICSLNPGVDRLTKTVEMEINSSGDIVNYDIYDSVINSSMAMSYSNVNKVLKGTIIEGYEKYVNDLKLMKELSDILNEKKNQRNYINFKTIEEEIIEEDNEIKGFKKNDYGTAGEIIENFMLLANVTFYTHYSWFILGYRVHEAPDEDKVKEILALLRSNDIKLPKLKNINANSLKTLIDNLEDNETSLIVREWLLRSMKKARYDTNNIGHFALQYPIYGHFTSPIRRIIDLVSQTISDMVDTFNYNDSCIKKLEEFVNKTCIDANKVEKIDQIIEEETKEMLMAKYMENKIGLEFEAYITNVSSHSIMVRTKDLIKGKIKLESLNGDKYYYDYNKKYVVGKNSNKKYRIGDKVYVIAKRASKQERTVEFEINNQKKLVKMP